jgi:hypothetical protein
MTSNLFKRRCETIIAWDARNVSRVITLQQYDGTIYDALLPELVRIHDD